ncbi:MAG: signal peptidase I [Lachnospiraceae bacterium]|nr:signal peptidase I [Lachnospiraceae bacterium]
MAKRHKGLHFYRRRKTISVGFLKELGSWGFLFALAVLIAFVFVYSVGLKTSVIGASMEPCLYNGQSVLINKFSYSFGSPKRGDVIVFLPNGNENTHYYIKRVVGLPGETITIKEGRIYLDGYFYEEDDSYDTIEDGGIAEKGISLGEEEYFVLGDNRNNSEDSRSANVGAVKEETIAGRAWFKLGDSIDKLGFIE